MRNIAVAAVLAFSAALAACSDTPVDKNISSDLTGPVMAKSTGVACTTAQSQLVEADQAVVFAAGTTRDSIVALWRKVKRDCSTTNATKMSVAQDALMEYIRYTLITFRDNPGDILPADNSAALVGHWNLAFPYVSYVAPGLPSDVLDNGAARVVSRTELAAAPVEFGIPTVAAMQTSPQTTGDKRGHLLVIYPQTGDCLPDQSALDESESCYNFKSFPVSSPSYNPRMKVGICYTDTFVTPGFGHYDGVSTTIEPTIVYPSTAFCHDENSVRYGSRGFLGRVTRLASKMFGVKRAYAAHGGLGTLAPGFSTFVPVDLNLFKATFTDVAIGSAPDSGELASPDKGYWTRVFSTSPGSIKVQSSLADLITRPVVLDQGGGACASNCGGLDLWAQIETDDGSRAVSDGQYLISWTSVQDQPAPKAAPFVARSKDGLEIARVSYSKENGGTRIRYNGAIVQGANWVRGNYQSFSLLVDFDARTTTLTVKNSLGATLATSTKNFVNDDAADLSQFRAEFSNIDSGVVGWDNILIERLPDSQ